MRPANLLGALGLHVSEAVRAAVEGRVHHGGVLPDAVIVIRDQPGRTVQWLAQALQLSQPGAVHLVQRLADLGWVAKRQGSTARSYALHLTPAGRTAADEILQAREAALADLVTLLSERQRAALTDIASTLLSPPAVDESSLAHLCRLCDRSCCPSCPVHEGYRERT